MAAELNDIRLAVPNTSSPYFELHMDPKEVLGEANSLFVVLDIRNLDYIFILAFISKQVKKHRALIYHENKASTER